MTRDDVIRAAGEAGFHFHDAGFAPTLHTVPLEYSEKCFERFAAIIEAAATEKANELADQRVVAEHEACAKACEDSVSGFSLLVELAQNIADEMNKKEGTA